MSDGDGLLKIADDYWLVSLVNCVFIIFVKMFSDVTYLFCILIFAEHLKHSDLIYWGVYEALSKLVMYLICASCVFL